VFNKKCENCLFNWQLECPTATLLKIIFSKKNDVMQKKWTIILTSLFAVGLFCTFIFSPYGTHFRFSYPVIVSTVRIEAPAESVFAYLGNSDNAAEWSVFVDHISPINAVKDGQVGSVRRCFTQADEKGATWDELITEVVLNKKRQLTIFNLVNFPMTGNNLATEQIYQTTGAKSCTLTFTVFFKDAKPTVFEYFKIKIAAYKIASIFEKNLNNIKQIVEKKYKNNGK
jgi:uncharacterized protein YndB with AHSA1/START domain